MKKIIFPAVALSLILLMTGCSGTKTEKTDSTTEKITEETTEKPESGDPGDTSKENPEEPIMPDNMQIYYDFLYGSEKVRYTGQNDLGTNLRLDSYLEVNGTYSVEDLISLLSVDVSEYSSGIVLDTDNPYEYRFIDCGKDGNPELVIDFKFISGDLFGLRCVIKDINGELCFCFDNDYWSRSDFEIDDNGVITSYGSGGATDHYNGASFLDADCNYFIYYNCHDSFDPSYGFSTFKDGEYINIDMSDLDTTNIMISSYFFTDWDADRTDYNILTVYDDDYNIMDPSTYEGLDELKDKFAQADIELYTFEQIDQMLMDRAEEIDFPGFG